MKQDPTRDDVNALRGPVVLEFGASWCGHCLAAQPSIAAQFKRFPQVKHVKIEDGPGQPLGRSFRVKLWPTLVMMQDGDIVTQCVRPSAAELQRAFDELAAAATAESK